MGLGDNARPCIRPRYQLCRHVGFFGTAGLRCRAPAIERVPMISTGGVRWIEMRSFALVAVTRTRLGVRSGVDLASKLTALTQRAASGDEQASQVLIEACETVPRLWEILSTLSSLAVRSWVDLLAPAGTAYEAEGPSALRRRRWIQRRHGNAPLMHHS